MIAAAPVEARDDVGFCSACGIDLTRFNRAESNDPCSRVQLCKGCDAALEAYRE